jgi:hypothetical protein
VKQTICLYQHLKLYNQSSEILTVCGTSGKLKNIPECCKSFIWNAPPDLQVCRNLHFIFIYVLKHAYALILTIWLYMIYLVKLSKSEIFTLGYFE